MLFGTGIKERKRKLKTKEGKGSNKGREGRGRKLASFGFISTEHWAKKDGENFN